MKLKSISFLIMAVTYNIFHTHTRTEVYLEKDLLFPPSTTQSESFKNCSAKHAVASTWGQTSPGFTVMHQHLKIQNCTAVP